MKILILIAVIACAACGSQPHPASTARAAGPLTVLHVLQDADGVAVRGALTELDGRLYGLAGEHGPSGSPQCSSTALWRTTEHTSRCPGSLFSLRLDGSDFRVDHAFTQLDAAGRNSDGYHPYGSLAVGPDRRLYGVTQAGGSPPDPSIPGFGVLFAYGPPVADPLGDPRSDTPGSYEVLHSFFAEARAADGEYPMGALAVDDDGDVFGTAKGGGATATGTAWEWSPGGAFRFASLPGESYGGVALVGGLLHGTTWSGGAAGVGAYFTADPATLQVRVIASFPGFTWNEHGTDNTPIQEPTRLCDGSVVVAREFGGAAGAGVVVQLDPRDGIRVLHDSADIPLDAVPRFSNATGGMLNGRVVEGRDGMIYGLAQYGGAAGTGGIYRLARDGSLFSLVYSFADAAYPYGGLTAGSDGALYGTTFNTGQVFRFDPR